MRSTALALLLVAGCARDAACGIAGAGPTDPDRDPIEYLADYAGPSFSELGDLEVDGDTVWFCSGVLGLNAYDATNPKRMRRLDDIEVSVGSSVYPRCQHLALAPDGMVYVSNRTNSIQTEAFVAAIDGTDPEDLVERTARVLAAEPEGLTVRGGFLLVASHEDGLLILDRSTLEEVARVTEGLTNPWQVRVDERGIAWVADGDAGLSAVDVRTPTEPGYLGTLPLDGQAKDLDLVGERAWVALGSTGLAVVDIANGSSPALLDQVDTPGSALGVAVSPGSDAAFVSDWNDLRLVDISDRDRVAIVGHEPLLLRADLESRSLGVAVGRDDLVFSGNWTALSSYRHHPEHRSGDLDASPARITLPRTDAGDTTSALLRIANAGSRPLELQEPKLKGRGLALELEPDTLAPGETATGRLTWTPSGSGPLSGWVNLHSDDADEPRKCIPVTGNQSGLTVGDRLPPDTSFVGLDGSIQRVDDRRGQVVLLSYFATF